MANMWTLASVNVLLLIGMLTVQLPETNACSCQQRHPQDHYCNSDFVIKARIKQERKVRRPSTTTDDFGNITTTFYGMRVYDVRISKVFKEAVGFQPGGRKKIYTPESDTMCGVKLSLGATYLLTGTINKEGEANIDICSESLVWFRIPIRVKKGYQYVYKRHCDCKISFCWKCDMPTPANTCLYNSRTDTGSCYLDHSHCKHVGNNTCDWGRTKLLKQCLKDEKERRWNEP